MAHSGTYDSSKDRPTWPDTSDEQLVSLARQGEPAAFEVLVRRYETRLFNYLRRMCGDAGDAEDLFQETFLRIYTNLDRYQPYRPFRPWAYRIATNACKDLLRKRARRPRPLRTKPGDDDARDATGQIPDRAANPRDSAQQTETAAKLADALQHLPAKHRAVFLMARYGDMRYDEVAQALGIPVGTVKSRMNKAVSYLMSVLQENAR